jgi:hypothetical protein
LRKRRDLALVLRIGVCWSEQRRATVTKSAIGSENRAQNVLHACHCLRHPAAV